MEELAGAGRELEELGPAVGKAASSKKRGSEGGGADLEEEGRGGSADGLPMVTMAVVRREN